MLDASDVNERGEVEPSVLDLHPETVILDRGQTEIARIKGVIPLPIGAVVQFGDPNVDTTVIGVRLLCGPKGQPALLCLDVEVPPPGYSRAALP
jgi:hypothetical protein